LTKGQWLGWTRKRRVHRLYVGLVKAFIVDVFRNNIALSNAPSTEIACSLTWHRVHTIHQHILVVALKYQSFTNERLSTTPPSQQLFHLHHLRAIAPLEAYAFNLLPGHLACTPNDSKPDCIH
jgi:hypothetical protein